MNAITLDRSSWHVSPKPRSTNLYLCIERPTKEVMIHYDPDFSACEHQRTVAEHTRVSNIRDLAVRTEATITRACAASCHEKKDSANVRSLSFLLFHS